MIAGIIFAVVLVAIAAYYPIKFYCMESKEQSFKTQIIKDLGAYILDSAAFNATRTTTTLHKIIRITLGEGGFRLTDRFLSVIFAWMVGHTNEWRVYAREGSDTVVVFEQSPFKPECWESLEDYKHVMRKMFGDGGTKGFLINRCSMNLAFDLQKQLKAMEKEEPSTVRLHDYVMFNFDGEETLGMITEVSEDYVYIRILTGVSRGARYILEMQKATVVSPESAIKELIRQKEEWKERKREEAKAKQRQEFLERYGNISKGTYLKKRDALYIVETVNLYHAKATVIRLIDLGLNFPAGKRCELPLENGFTVITADEAAEILLKTYSNE